MEAERAVGRPVTNATPTLPRSVLVRSRILACAVPRFRIGAVLERAPQVQLPRTPCAHDSPGA
jgi:hypothetical protein